MSLWPGYYLGKMGTIPEPILDEMPVIRMDTSIEPLSETKSASGSFFLFGKRGSLLTANGLIVMEQFGAGTAITWMYPFDEFHYIIQGEADVTYTLASTENQVEKKMHVGVGDFFITPIGSIVEFKIWDQSPLRRICGLMPGTALNQGQLTNLYKE